MHDHDSPSDLSIGDHSLHESDRDFNDSPRYVISYSLHHHVSRRVCVDASMQIRSGWSGPAACNLQPVASFEAG